MRKNNYGNNPNLVKNFIWRAIQLIGKEGAIFIIFFMCAKLLNAYKFGLYNYMLAGIFFLMIFGDFGISTATSKYVAEYQIKNKKKLSAVLFNSGIIITGLTLLVILVVLLLGKQYFQEKYYYILYLLPVIFLAPMTSLYDGIYRGLKKFKQLAIISIWTGIFSVIITYFLIYYFNLIGALISQTVLYLTLLIFLAIGHKEINFKINLPVMKEICKYSIYIGIASIGYFLFTRINSLILGNFGFIVEVGYYELINKILLILIIPFTILAQVMAPDITTLYAQKKARVILALYKRYMFLAILFGFLISLVVWIIFPIILKYFLSEYNLPIIQISMNFLLIILTTQCASTIAAAGFSTASGHAKLNMIWLIIFGILNTILGIFWVHSLGFMGIIYTTVIIKFLSDITFIIFYYFILKRSILHGKK